MEARQLRVQIPENLRREILDSAVEFLRRYKGFELRRFVEWCPQALHIGEAREYVNGELNMIYQNRLRAEAIRTNVGQKRPFRRALKEIVEEAANQIGHPRAAPEGFPNNYAYVPISR